MSEATVLRSAEGGGYVLEGELGFRTAARLLSQSSSLFDWGVTLKVDLSAVTRADSAGLALLLEWMRRAAAAGGAIRYSGLPEQLRQIARAGDLEGLLPLD